MRLKQVIEFIINNYIKISYVIYWMSAVTYMCFLKNTDDKLKAMFIAYILQFVFWFFKGYATEKVLWKIFSSLSSTLIGLIAIFIFHIFRSKKE